MLRRSLACLAVLAACGSAAPQPPASPASPPTATHAPPPAADVDVARWTARLDDAHDSERAIAELEALGDARAIPALGKAWNAQRRPVRMLQAIIALAKRTGRWDDALPFLGQALTEVDDANPRSVDSALAAADAIGEAHLAAGLPALASLAHRPATKKLIAAQVAAIRALGKLSADRARATAALVQLLEREPPPHPRDIRGPDRRPHLERFELALTATGASINALAELRAEAATAPLVLTMYRLPELNRQTWRALAAIGPRAVDELRRILRGEHAAVNQLFRAKQLDRACSDPTDPSDPSAPAAPFCEPVSAMDAYAAGALGALLDPTAVPDLLAALKRPAKPAYILDDAPGPSQHTFILDALRKIGAPEAAPTVRALWTDRKVALATRAAAIATYPFLSTDGAAADELGKIAADNRAEDELRLEAATAYARLSREPRSIALFQSLAQRYLDASAKKRREADREKPRADAADKDLEPRKQALDKMKIDLLALTKDERVGAAEIRAATAAVKRAEADLKDAWRAHREKTRPYKQLDQQAKAYLGFARTFQVHIVRVDVALRCKEGLSCYEAHLRITTDEVAKNVTPYIKDAFQWTVDDQRLLVEAAVDRALLELGRRGVNAAPMLGAVLALLANESRAIRQAALLALPRIARSPCAECVEKLDLAIQSTQGKPLFADVAQEAALLRAYFTRGEAK